MPCEDLNRLGGMARAIRQLSAFVRVIFQGLVVVFVADGVGLAVLPLALARAFVVVLVSPADAFSSPDGASDSPQAVTVAMQSANVATVRRCLAALDLEFTGT